jgi:hypothetical protein
MSGCFALIYTHFKCAGKTPEVLPNHFSGRLTFMTLMLFLTSTANASILTFDQIRQVGVVVPTISGNDLEDDYGDRITGTSMNVPGGQFTYGNGGEGFTPNVTTHFVAGNGSSLSLWRDSYGDLTNVAFGSNLSASLIVQLTADPGYTVDLYHFDLAGWFLRDYTIDAVRVVSDAGTLFFQDNVLVQGANDGGPMHTSFDFAAPLSGAVLTLQIDYGNLTDSTQDNIGIDNIRFGQNPPAAVPIPATLWLFGSGVMGLLGIAIRKRAC